MKRIIIVALMLVSAVSYAQEQEIRLFSHRGGRLEFDENTMSAFQASYETISLCSHMGITPSRP